MLEEFTVTQKRALAILTVVALFFGAYFLRRYLILIAVAAVIAYLFTPLYNRLRTRMNVGLSATLTLLATIAIVGIPLGGVIFLAVLQIGQMVTGITHWMANNDLTALGQRLLASANRMLSEVPFMHINLTPEGVRAAIARVGQNIGEMALHFARDSVGSLATIVTSAIIFLYVFLALVVNGPKVAALFRDLNPLGQRGFRHLPRQDRRDGDGHGAGPVHHRGVPGCGRGDLDLHRRDPRRLLHVRHLPDGAVVHPAGQRHRDNPAGYRNGVVRQRRSVACSSSCST